MKKCVSGIYGIINLVNGKIYIGSAVDIRNRWYTHKINLRNNKHQNKYLQRSWNEYGELNFKFFILEICVKLDLIKREQIWMNYNNSYDFKFGYNLARVAGSQLGYRHTEETKNKLRNVIFDADKKIKMSEGQKGKRHTKETKLKIAISCTGRKLSKEAKLKISQTHKGKKQSLEHIAKLSLVRKGRSINRNLSKWPHELGSKCTCRVCLDRNNKVRRS